jgi:phosphatidylserine synthase
MSDLKIINSCQRCIHKYENVKRKLYNFNANIYFNRTCLIQQNLSGAFCRTNIKRYLPMIIVNCISHPPWTQKAVCFPILWVNDYHFTQRDVQETFFLVMVDGIWGWNPYQIPHHIPYMKQHHNHCSVTFGWCFKMALIMLVTLGVVFREAFLFPVISSLFCFRKKVPIKD